VRKRKETPEQADERRFNAWAARTPLPPAADREVEAAIKRIDTIQRTQWGDPPPDEQTAKMMFQGRLRAAMDVKGWRQSDLARHCARLSGQEFNRDTVSTYLRKNKSHMPGRANVTIMAKALGVPPDLLLPERERQISQVDGHAIGWSAERQENGLSFLRIRMAVRPMTAAKIIGILSEEENVLQDIPPTKTGKSADHGSRGRTQVSEHGRRG
jgi:transcriptional regulator with XRE-family HTH domain